MYLNILKKDMKRKKTMNIILLLFITMAAMFVSSSVSNIITALNGTDYFFEQAEMSDYIVIQSGGRDALEQAENALCENEIYDYRIEPIRFCSNDMVYFNGTAAEGKEYSYIVTSIDDAQLKYFDADDNVISDVKKGEAYVTAYLFDELDVSVGDTIELITEDKIISLKIKGAMKDALFGSPLLADPRILVNSGDLADLAAETSEENARIIYINSDDNGKIQQAVGGMDNVLFPASRDTIKRAYILDMLIIAMLLVVSIVLILIAAVVLKFTISLTLSEEFREIGVMKAIGIKNSRIRLIYLTKYIAITLMGSTVGLAAGFPFGRMMLSGVSEKMVLGNHGGIWLNILSSAAVALSVILISLRITAKVKNSSPLDAIRNGQTGERFGIKRGLRIGKSRLDAPAFIALNDVLSSIGKYGALVLAFTLSLSLLLTIVITASTLVGDSLYPTFGLVESHAFIRADAEEIKTYSGREMLESTFERYAEEITAAGMPCKCCEEVVVSISVSHGGNTIPSMAQIGIGGQKAEDYIYSKGSAPINSREIAVTENVAHMIGAAIGDTVKIRMNGKEDEYLITAYFNSMNSLGNIIRLHPDTGIDLESISSFFPYQIIFTDSPDKKELENRLEKLREMYGEDNVFSKSGFVADNIGAGDAMKPLKLLVLGLTMIITALITVLMERSFIAGEKSEIAVMKAIGFRSADICRIHTLRFAIVSAAAAVLGGIAAIPVTHLCITPIFGIMGSHSIKYVIEPVEIFLIYPASVIAVIIAAAWLTSLYTRRIKASDASAIE